jgi:hypothetical protein
MSKKRGVGAAIKGFGAVFSETTEQAKKPAPVDVNFDKQKYEGTVDTPKTQRIPQPTSF